MRICLLLPRYIPQLPAASTSAARRVNALVTCYPQTYRAGLATAVSACLRGHEVQCVLVGPDGTDSVTPKSEFDDIDPDLFDNSDHVIDVVPDAEQSKSEKTKNQTKDILFDPAVAHLAAAFPTQIRVGFATQPDDTSESMLDSIAEIGDSLTQWVQSITGAANPGAHVIIDAIGPEVSGGAKYFLMEYDKKKNGFPGSECLVKSICQIVASGKLVHSLASAEAEEQRAPDAAVIPPSFRDASKAHMPRSLQFADPDNAHKSAAQLAEEDAADAESAADLKRLKDIPEHTLVVSLASWRLLRVAPWSARNVVHLPLFDGGETNDVQVAVVEEGLKRYFNEFFKQRTFPDFGFFAMPPLVAPGVAQTAGSGDALRAAAFAKTERPLVLHTESLPFKVSRLLAVLPGSAQAWLVGASAAAHGKLGFAGDVSADRLGDTILGEIDHYLAVDAEVRHSIFKTRGILDESRAKEKLNEMRIGSHLRFAFSGTPDDAEGKDSKTENPMKWMRHAQALIDTYSKPMDG